MNKILQITAVLLLVWGCRSGKNLPEGAPEKIRPSELKEKVQEAENRFNSLLVRATGRYTDAGGSQSFRFEARLAGDTLIWVDLADPILGIKVARAVVYPDSVAFVNRLQKQYLTGSLSALQQRLKLDFGFKTIQAILSANLLSPVTSDYDLFYRPGAYVLADFGMDGQEDPSRYAGQQEFHQVFFNPILFKPEQQVQNQPVAGENYVVKNETFELRNGLLYPQKITVEYLFQGQSGTLELDVKDIVVNDTSLNYPFNIPSGYVQMR